MIAAHHLYWTAYGWWLPNDPRGSSSQEVRVTWLEELGELHHGRKKIQPPPADIRDFYRKAEKVLKFELRTFTDEEMVVLGKSFAGTLSKHRYTCYACAFMPDHVHLLIRKHRHEAEEMIANFQAASREAILEKAWREPGHPVWTEGGGKVFLETRAEIRRTVKYIVDNPVKIGRPVQRWDFVNEYDGWLPGVGKERPASTRNEMR